MRGAETVSLVPAPPQTVTPSQSCAFLSVLLINSGTPAVPKVSARGSHIRGGQGIPEIRVQRRSGGEPGLASPLPGLSHKAMGGRVNTYLRGALGVRHPPGMAQEGLLSRPRGPERVGDFFPWRSGDPLERRRRGRERRTASAWLAGKGRWLFSGAPGSITRSPLRALGCHPLSLLWGKYFGSSRIDSHHLVCMVSAREGS